MIYHCPVVTCNVSFSGSLDEIAPQAAMHAGGSHQVNLGYNEIAELIELQARGLDKSVSPSLNPSVVNSEDISEMPKPQETTLQEEKPSVSNDNPDWWKV